MTIGDTLDPGLQLRLRQLAAGDAATRRAAVRLSWHGLSDTEIAETMGLTLSQVRELVPWSERAPA